MQRVKGRGEKEGREKKWEGNGGERSRKGKEKKKGRERSGRGGEMKRKGKTWLTKSYVDYSSYNTGLYRLAHNTKLS